MPKPHFPASEVVPATIKALGEDLFGHGTRPPDDAKLWHYDRELYEVAKDDVIVGHVARSEVLDGKFGHQMSCPPGPRGRQPNRRAVLGNMGDANGRLRFREVETLPRTGPRFLVPRRRVGRRFSGLAPGLAGRRRDGYVEAVDAHAAVCVRGGRVRNVVCFTRPPRHRRRSPAQVRACGLAKIARPHAETVPRRRQKRSRRSRRTGTS